MVDSCNRSVLYVFTTAVVEKILENGCRIEDFVWVLDLFLYLLYMCDRREIS